MRLSEIKNITAAISSDGEEDREITELAIDSRKIVNVSDCLFIALKGTFRDGHQFIPEAYKKGISCFLISEQLPEPTNYPGAVFLKVKNPLKALQKIALAKRKKSSFTVIGITGSNGKTIIKEWLFQLLASDYQIVRNPKSYNSQIGVPLSIWNIKPGDNLGIFEAGISQPGEMEQLEEIIRPEIGLFTNIGDAHSEGFLSKEQKIREKLLLFRRVKQLFYCRDHEEIQEQVLSFLSQLKEQNLPTPELCCWSKISVASLQILNTQSRDNKTIIKAKFSEQITEISIPFTDEASIENAIHCWNVLLHLSIPKDLIKKRFEQLLPVAMRLESLSGINNCLLINDTYNSDLTSLRIAIDALINQKQGRRKTVILSDLLQIGDKEEVLYEKIAGWLREKNIQRLIGIGSAISQNKNSFRKNDDLQSYFFTSTEHFLKDFHLFDFENEAILIKGARPFKFEKIVRLLGQKIHNTVLEVNLSALNNNLKVYKNHVLPEVKIMAMVKAFSYGSGSYEIAHALQEAGTDYLAVAYVDEGVLLRQAGIQMQIMVMSPEAGTYDRLVFWNLEPEIFSLESLHLFQNAAKAIGKTKYPVHLKIDSGMHRLGFMGSDIEDLKLELKDNPFLNVVSIFSHLAASDDPKLDDFTRSQVGTFTQMAEDICTVLPEKPLFHILNSTGIIRHPKYQFDMVRLGLGLHGIDNSNLIQKQLIPIGTLKTTIAQIHELPAGAYVGYDLREKVKRQSRIATVNIGYADGYFRNFGNRKGFMLVHNQKVPVVGAVCMDMCMLDVTDIPKAEAGDEVIVFGKNPGLKQLAKWANTIPYEVMTAISQRVSRVYINE